MPFSQTFSQLVVALKKDCHDVLLHPEEGWTSDSQPIISISIVRNTRGYVERIAHQIRGARWQYYLLLGSDKVSRVRSSHITMCCRRVAGPGIGLSWCAIA